VALVIERSRVRIPPRAPHQCRSAAFQAVDLPPVAAAGTPLAPPETRGTPQPRAVIHPKRTIRAVFAQMRCSSEGPDSAGISSDYLASLGDPTRFGSTAARHGAAAVLGPQRDVDPALGKVEVAPGLTPPPAGWEAEAGRGVGLPLSVWKRKPSAPSGTKQAKPLQSGDTPERHFGAEA
jgi:hypothetical protein